MRLLLPLVLLSLVGTTPAAASPATDFFAAVRAHIDERYYAKPDLDVKAVFDAAEARLVSACLSQGKDCPLEAGLAEARLALAALGDSHTRLEEPAPLAASAAVGPAARLAPLGWVIRKERSGDAFYVAWIAPDGPAARAGVHRHDLLLAPPGSTATALTALSTPGTHTISRGGRAFEVELTPAEGSPIPMPRLERRGDAAILQVPVGSGDGVAQAAHDLIARAQAEGAKTLILDLRDNGGGGVQCAAMASAFVDYTIVQTDPRGGRQVLTVSPGQARVVTDGSEDVEALILDRPIRWEGPMAILVNDNTGSCSEAVAIQASLAGRALIIGEPSVGVGNNVVMTYPIEAGWRLVMTVAYSTTLDGRALPARPRLDVAVEDDPVSIAATGRDTVLEAALRALQA